MTNLDIIIQEAINHNIFTEEQIEGYLSEGSLPLKTYLSWKNEGYQIKKGEKAVLSTKLWKLRPKKKTAEQEKQDEQEQEEQFILVPAHLFTREQVVKIGEQQ